MCICVCAPKGGGLELSLCGVCKAVHMCLSVGCMWCVRECLYASVGFVISLSMYVLCNAVYVL